MSEPLESERRINVVLLNYWNELRGGREFPCENDLDPEALAEIWEHCFLIQVRDIENVEDYNYTFLGRKILDAYADGILDLENGRLVTPNATKLMHSFQRVLETRKPLLENGEFHTISNKTVRFRQCLLPLGNEAGHIESIFGGMRFKLYVE